MTDRPQADFPDVPESAPMRPKRVPRTPQETLTSSMVVYIAINFIFSVPLVIVPEEFFDLVGLDEIAARQAAGVRWLGASLLAWAIAGLVVLARPEGRAIFVTAGALQLTLGALAFLYSWSTGELNSWALWYRITATAILVVGAVYLSWARYKGRAVFKRGVAG